MMRKYPKFILFFVLFCLIGAGFFYFSNTWKGDETKTQTAQNLKLLTSHSQPEAGDKWVVSFETVGPADLTITPADSDSVEDLDFISLSCDGKEKAEEGVLQILDGDVIFYSDWRCDGRGEVIHLVNIARKHTLKFQFSNKMAFAYNNPDSVTDTFTNEDYIASKENITVSGGQVYLSTCKDNGTACSLGSECCSNNCIDSYCCNSACGGNCDRCNVGGSLGTCTNVDSDCTGDCDVCSGGNCAANNSLCDCDTCSGSGTEFNCLDDNVTTNWGAGTYGCSAGASTDPNRCYNGDCINCGGWGNAGYCWYQEGAMYDGCDVTCTDYGGVYNGTCDWVDDPADCSTCLHFFPSYAVGGESSFGPDAYYDTKLMADFCHYHGDGYNYCTGRDSNRQCACNR